jgi:transposase
MDIDLEALQTYFTTHTLKQCAKQFGCSKATIKRRLQAIGADTSIHNHSALALDAYRASRKDTSMLTEELLRREYLVENKDSKTIAEETGFHYNTIRARLRKYGLKKDAKNVSISMRARYLKKTGYFHPGCNPVNIHKVHSGRTRFQYESIKTDRVCLFRSLHELSYALLLDDDSNVERWDFELLSIPYISRLDGKHHMYLIDFSIQSRSGDKWVEVKPADKMIPADKRLYAAQAAKGRSIKYGGITTAEREAGYELFKSGMNADRIAFKNPAKLKPESCYTLWFKDINELEGITYDHHMYTDAIGPYARCKFKAKAQNKLRPTS